MAADRHEAALIAADVAFDEAEVEDHLAGVGPEGVLSDAHAPDENSIFRAVNEFGKLLHLRAFETGLFLKRGPVEGTDCVPQIFETDAVVFDEIIVLPAVLENDFENAVEERDVAALGDRKPIVGDIGAEDRA